MFANASGGSGTPLIPNFGTATFRSAKVDGKTPEAARASAYNMRTSGRVLQIATSALNTSGDGWSEIFKHS
jgi:hypothetical protein